MSAPSRRSRYSISVWARPASPSGSGSGSSLLGTTMKPLSVCIISLGFGAALRNLPNGRLTGSASTARTARMTASPSLGFHRVGEPRKVPDHRLGFSRPRNTDNSSRMSNTGTPRSGESATIILTGTDLGRPETSRLVFGPGTPLRSLQNSHPARGPG